MKPNRRLQNSAFPTDNKNAVRREIYSWWTEPLGNELQDSVQTIDAGLTVNNSTTRCMYRTYQFSKSGYLTMNIDQPTSVLYPGSLVQGKSIKTGAEPL